MRRNPLAPTLVLLLTAPVAAAQSIFTVAGGGTDDGRPATSAALAYPFAAVYDAAGNLYVADTNDHRVRRVDAKTQVITTVAGSGASGYAGDGRPAWGATLSSPSGLAFDRFGNLYIADSGNARIRRVRAGTGVIETIAGTGSWGFSGDGGPALQAEFAQPLALALDFDGNLLVADSSNDRVRRIDLKTSIVSTLAGNGTEASSGDGGPATLAAVSFPVALAVDPGGNVFVAENEGHRVRRIDRATGTIATVAGTGEPGFSGDGGPGPAARLYRPRGLAFDPGIVIT